MILLHNGTGQTSTISYGVAGAKGYRVTESVVAHVWFLKQLMATVDPNNACWYRMAVTG